MPNKLSSYYATQAMTHQQSQTPHFPCLPIVTNSRTTLPLSLLRTILSYNLTLLILPIYQALSTYTNSILIFSLFMRFPDTSYICIMHMPYPCILYHHYLVYPNHTIPYVCIQYNSHIHTSFCRNSCHTSLHAHNMTNYPIYVYHTHMSYDQFQIIPFICITYIYIT